MGQHNELIRSIYATAFEDRPWQDAMSGAARILDATSSVLFTTFIAPDAGGVLVPTGMPEPLIRKFLAEVATVDIWFHELLRRNTRLATGFQYDTNNLVPESVLRRSRFYSDYLRPCDIGRGMGAIVGDNSTAFSPLTPLCFYRPVESKPFSKADHANLRTFSQHFSEALTLRHRIRQSEGTGAFLAVERIATPVLVVGRSRQILFANPAAAEFFRTPEGLARAGRLCSADPAAAAALERAIAACAAYRFDNGLSLSIRLSGAPGAGVVARLTPVPGGAGNAGAAAAIVFLAREGKSPIDLGAALSAIYKLSPVEVDLVKRLAEGLTPEEIAVRREVVLATVKTQLRSVFAKTGTRRQADLMRLIFSIAH